MSNYTAPVEDMGFVLKEVVEIEKLCNETGLDSSTVDIIDTVLDAAGKLAKEEIEPINKPGDSEGLKIDGSGKVTTAGGLPTFCRRWMGFAAILSKLWRPRCSIRSCCKRSRDVAFCKYVMGPMSTSYTGRSRSDNS